MKDLSQRQTWYVLYTKPNFEKKTYTNLLERNIEAFLPLQNVMRQRSDRKKKLEIPLFPNYIFVRIDPKRRWELLKVYGIIRFLTRGNSAEVVSDEQMNGIKKLMFGEPEIFPTNYVRGETLKIISGPLADLSGVLINENESKLAVRVNILRQYVIVKVSPCDLERLAVVS